MLGNFSVEQSFLPWCRAQCSELCQQNQQHSEGHTVKHYRVNVQLTTTILEKRPALVRRASLICALCLPCSQLVSCYRTACYHSRCQATC